MRKTTTSWKPGSSGNPRGRPRGSGFAGRVRAAIEADVPDILKALVAQAKTGDPAAARLLLERVVAPLKPMEAAQPLTLPHDGPAAEQGAALLRAIAAGELAVTPGAVLLRAVADLQRTVELDEMLRRIEALESSRSAPDEKP